MARKLPELGGAKAAELEAAWQEHTAAWARERLLVLKLVAQHALNAAQIAAAAGVSRSTVFRYIGKFETGGVAGLLQREHKGGSAPTLQGKDLEAFTAELRAGRFRRAKEARAWIEARTQAKLALSSVYKLLGKVGGVLKVPRKTPPKKTPPRPKRSRPCWRSAWPRRAAAPSVSGCACGCWTSTATGSCR